MDKKTQLGDFFNNNEIVLYNNINDLADKIRFYKKNDNLRKQIAKNGKKKYFNLFSELKITKYLINKSFGNDIVNLLLIVLQVTLNSCWNYSMVICNFLIIKNTFGFLYFLT